METPLLKLEEALALMAQTHRSMGHDPLLMMAIARQTIARDHPQDMLEAVDEELGKMSADTFSEAVVGSDSVPVSRLALDVLTSMRQSIMGQDAVPPIEVPKDTSQEATEGP